MGVNPLPRAVPEGFDDLYLHRGRVHARRAPGSRRSGSGPRSCRGMGRSRLRLHISSRPGLGALDMNVGKPAKPFRQVPVAVAQQFHRRRNEHQANERRVEQQRDGDAKPHLLEHHKVAPGEVAQDRDDDQGGAGDNPARRRRCDLPRLRRFRCSSPARDRTVGRATRLDWAAVASSPIGDLRCQVRQRNPQGRFRSKSESSNRRSQPKRTRHRIRGGWPPRLQSPNPPSRRPRSFAAR